MTTKFIVKAAPDEQQVLFEHTHTHTHTHADFLTILSVEAELTLAKLGSGSVAPLAKLGSGFRVVVDKDQLGPPGPSGGAQLVHFQIAGC